MGFMELINVVNDYKAEMERASEEKRKLIALDEQFTREMSQLGYDVKKIREEMTT